MPAELSYGGKVMEQYKILVKGIVEQDGKYLVVETWYDDNISNPYQWEFVDGAIEFGETPDAAVLRIIKEKTNIVAEISQPLYTWGLKNGNIYTVGIAYLCIAASDDVVLSDDINSYKWIEKHEIEEYIFNKYVIEDLYRAEFM